MFFSVFILFVFVLTFLLAIKLVWPASVPSLRKKHVLITGGSSGIGLSTAIKASEVGAHVTIIARNKSKLEAAVEEIKKVAKYPNEQKIVYLSLDVTQGWECVDKAVESAEQSSGPIFLLVNCAGMAICGEFDKAVESDFRYMMDLNYFGTVFPTISVAKKMKTRKEGHIVITGSQASLIGIYGMSAYCSSKFALRGFAESLHMEVSNSSSKFALRGFAESLHMELSAYNISVTVCLPPDTDTPGFATEEKSKPEVTKLISETAGLSNPQTVAIQLLSDALSKKFFSSMGFEGLILTTLCAGMSPVCSVIDTGLQVILMGLLRLVSIGYLLHFQKIVTTHLKLSGGNRKSKKIE